GRSSGLERLEDVVAPDFESRMSPELGRRVLSGVEELRLFGDALEQDFERFSYDATQFVEAPDGRIVVLGHTTAVARASKLSLGGEFGHVWTIAGGKAKRVEAYSDHQDALRAAGAA